MNDSVAFSDYFQDWLYGRNGYYANYKTIGKDGDFYTAVSSSRFFGGSIGKRVVDIIKDGFLSPDTTIVEIGAHHGYLLADMIQFIFTIEPALIKTLKFAIVERYAHLQKKQKEYFEKCFGDEIELIHYNDISQLKLESAFVVANEIFDAFPCELVFTDTKIDTLQIASVKNHIINFEENIDKNIQNHCEKYTISKGEIAVGYEEFAATLAKNIQHFEFISFDYGELYPRNDFSCRIYEKHSVFPLFDEQVNLEKYYQRSDITYDVHFGHLIDCFKNNGIQHISYETQLKALVRFGIIELLEILHKNVDEKIYLSEANKVKTLLNPTGMGDRFKMVCFRKLKIKK
ncbi:MAG: SAM-dependent methyltransferase [Arcobacteraceae bacterium]